MAASVVTPDLSFRNEEHLRSAYHSFANLINVVHAELQLLERMCGPDSNLRPTIRLCEAATWSFKDPDAAAEHGEALTEFRTRVQTDISRVQAIPKYEQDAEEARGLIREVLNDVDLRTQQLLTYHGITRTMTLHDARTVRDMILGGAVETVGVDQTDRVEVTIGDSMSMPHGLFNAVGRLAGELLRDSGRVDITAGVATRDPEALVLRADPVAFSVVPTEPPASMDSDEPGGRVLALIALVSYVAGPGLEVAVDPAGSPFLQIRSR